MKRRLGSVRARATLAATVVVAVALVAAGAAVLLSLRFTLTDKADAEADSVARNAASALANGFAYAELRLPDGDENPVEVLDRDEKPVAVGEDVEGMDVTAIDSDRLNSETNDDADDRAEGDKDAEDGGSLRAGEIADETWYGEGTATVEGDTADYRFAGVDVVTPAGVPLTVYAGAPLSTEEDAVGTALTTMLIGLPLLLLTVSGVTYVVTRRALRPVEGIRAEMAAITASEDLSRRVPEPDTHDEGAAHPELLDLDGAVEDTVRLQSLAADLLLLARLDAGERPPPDARFDLVRVVREEVASREGVTLDGVDAVELRGSRNQICRVLGNLLDNAARHAHSRVAVTLRTTPDLAILQVTDDGSGVPPADRERIFERFVRLDESRARDDGGAGLGLAIARDIATRHGGTLTIDDAPGGGALFELRLPLRPPST